MLRNQRNIFLRLAQTERRQPFWSLITWVVVWTLRHWSLVIPGAIWLWLRQVGIWHLLFGHFLCFSHVSTHSFKHNSYAKHTLRKFTRFIPSTAIIET
jgi:hypothetical protein